MATTSPCPNVGCYFRNQRNWNFIWPAEALVLSRENLNSPGFIQSSGIFPRNLRHMFAPFSGGSRPSGLRASVCSSGCPKSSFLYFISLYFSTIGLGKQIILKKKLCLSIEFAIFVVVAPSFDSNIRFVYFRPKGARARVYFPALFFLYFIAWIALTPSLFLVNMEKDKPP